MATGGVVRMDQFGRRLLTRERGREVAAELPRPKQLLLDFKNVEAASPSFIDQLIRGLSAGGTEILIFLNVSDRTSETVKRLRRMVERPARDLEVQVG